MIVLLRSNEINPDPRVQKYIDFYEENKINYNIIAWERSGKELSKKNIEYIKIKSMYGGRNKNIKNIIFWNWELLKKLYLKKNEIQVIHACDFDTILPAILMKIIFKKKIIYDIFDWYVDSRGIYNSRVGKIIEKIEQLVAIYSDYLIICDIERKNQIKISHNNLYVFQNVPSLNMSKCKERTYTENILRISYVGILGENRGLLELVEVVKNNKMLSLEIAGFGDLKDEILREIKDIKNIKFYGKVKYDKGLEIMSNSDLIYGMYYTINKNNRYAAPNKYYESIYLAKPLLTNQGTLVANKIKKYETGYIVNEGRKALEEFFLIFKKDNNYFYKIKNCKNIWNDRYKDYTKIFLNEVYLKKMILGDESEDNICNF
ncbi:hypothetical protein [Cetobacterium sp.]|uniref:hypothetical protein n=1 Tax=Cetobacterium sp. TaxID=2071632 RepID=UPI003F3B7C6C